MEPTPLETKKLLDEDLKSFECLPTKTKELQILMDQAEKTSGKEKAAIHKVIQDKSE